MDAARAAGGDNSWQKDKDNCQNDGFVRGEVENYEYYWYYTW